MNDCNSATGNGSCNSTTGLCTCTGNWKGGDCSLESVALTSMTDAATITTTGAAWKAMHFAGDATLTDIALEFTTTYPIDIYVSLGGTSDPDRYIYDWKFSNTSSDFRLSSKYLPMLAGTNGFAVTVYISAYNEKENALYDNSLTYKFTAGESLSENQPLFTQ
jgi:hypothetical protein